VFKIPTIYFMKLQTKLLWGVGILLFLMIVGIYIVPTFFIRRDVSAAADQIQSLLVENQEELIRSQQIWLENTLTYTKQNTNAQLYMIAEEPAKTTSITFDTSDYAVWNGLARIAGYNSFIGYLQAHNPDKNKTAIIMPHATTLYSINTFSHAEGDGMISLLDPGDPTKERGFLAVQVPESLQIAKGYTLYALIDRDQSHGESNGLQRVFSQISLLGALEKLESAPTSPSELQNNAGLSWGIKIDMIRLLTPFFAEGLSLGYDSIPAGLARVDNEGNGYAILSHEVYATEPLFDDVGYYKLHQPRATSSLADGAAIITVRQGDYTYIGNTLYKNGTYLTIATTLGILPQQLALSANKTILLNVNQDFWIGFDGDGKKVSQRRIDEIVHAKIAAEESGVINLEKGPFYFHLITSLENGTLQFFEFRPLKTVESIFSTLSSLQNELSNRISLQLFLISIATMILVLLFIGRMGYTVIHPITKLADATQFVAGGRYGEVQIPDVGNRQDEVAILTRSFGDMVKGLQEREKIRGVLDKVVSKDVADEILKSQIHLGGEDRVVTMLFCDIRGFSHLTAKRSPQDTITMLNQCMTKVSRVIEGEGGVIDKYVGDEVMAIYGAPASHPDHALRAVSTGMLIIETLKNWNQQRMRDQEPAIEMGIGIHTGMVVVGNMGSEDRLNYTALGANVNLAQRLCEVAKPNQLMISAATLAEPKIADSFYANRLQPLILKGFSEPVEIYEITGFKWDEE
jgi:class 3 adenylate cyclase